MSDGSAAPAKAKPHAYHRSRWNGVDSLRLIDVADLARFFDVHPETVRRRIREGDWTRVPRPFEGPRRRGYVWRAEDVSGWLTEQGLHGADIGDDLSQARRRIGDD